MSIHPNAILLLTLTPSGLSRKTMAAILSECDEDSCGDVIISGKRYNHVVMESDYDESFDIGAKEGDLLFFDFVTYGYGEQVSWADLEDQKTDLEAWAVGICDRHSCSYKISVTANYW